jgi:hypothetical protein
VYSNLSRPSAQVRVGLWCSSLCGLFYEWPYFRKRERERECVTIMFYYFYPYPLWKKCVWLFITSLLVLLFSFEVPLKKNIKKSCSKKKRKRKNKRQQRRGFVCAFFLFLRWCFVITFVSRLASLAQSILGPVYYHRWTISQLAFFANMVLVLPCLLLSATYSFIWILVLALIHPLPGCWLVGCLLHPMEQGKNW